MPEAPGLRRSESSGTMSNDLSQHVLVVAGAAAKAALPPALVSAIERSAVSQLGARRDLDPGSACEWPVLPGASVPDTMDAVRSAVGDAPLDVNLVGAADRRKGLLVADMDSTIIEQECIDEMADMLGLKAHIAAITERAMRGELGFEAALTERLSLLAGLAEAKLQQVFDERITLMPGARTLIATMTANGAFTALVSGGFSFFTSRVARLVGFHVDHSNTLGMTGGKLTGSVVGPILGKEAKLAALESYMTARRLRRSQTLAVGDGANDLAMIKAAGLGVAYRAKPVVAAEASASINHGDLTSLLYLQGYARHEFAA